jgi:sigma-54 specific flagellar transcriptional regulator A
MPAIEEHADIPSDTSFASAPAPAQIAMPQNRAGVGTPATETRDAFDPAKFSPNTTLPPQGIDLRGHMAGIELELIRAALNQSGGVVAHAAPLLGLRRTTLVEKLRKYGIFRDQAEAAQADNAA